MSKPACWICHGRGIVTPIYNSVPTICPNPNCTHKNKLSIIGQLQGWIDDLDDPSKSDEELDAELKRITKQIKGRKHA